MFDDRRDKLKGMPQFLLVIFSFVMLIKAGSEVEYGFSGKTATGTVINLSTRDCHDRNNYWTEVKLDYRFTDGDGVIRNASDEAESTRWQTMPTVGSDIGVQYLPRGGSRLACREDRSAIGVFFAFLFIYGLWWAYVKFETVDYYA